MSKKDLKSNIKLKVLEYLAKDPIITVNKLAKKLGTYRQLVDKEKKELEDDHVIWGYTTIIDGSKLNHVLYIAIFKIRPMLSKEFAELVIRRLLTGSPKKHGVQLIEVLYTHGEYDVIVKFSALDHTTARRYYETIRSVYSDYFLEEPIILDVNFSLVQMGKLNPELKKLYDFIPKVKTKIKT